MNLPKRTYAHTCMFKLLCEINTFKCSYLSLHQDGKYTTSQLCELLRNDEAFYEAKERIIRTDVLIIDQISMVRVWTYEIIEPFRM